MANSPALALKHWLREKLERAVGLHDKRVFLHSLYQSSDARRAPGFGYSMDEAFAHSGPFKNGKPVPPWQLFVGYYRDPDGYLKSGAAVADNIRQVWRDHALDPAGARVLDWGCAAGRVLRQFEAEAEQGEFWGADPAESAIFWASMNLNPPFNFVTCNQYPHLPFEDNYFDFIYGISVFTHLEYLVDGWLMELRRIMKPGALALFSVHNEHSIAHFEAKGYPYFMDAARAQEALKHRHFVLRSTDWEGTLPFYRNDFLTEWWGKYFEVVEIRNCYIDEFQSAIILRKRPPR